jgi:heme-degrading monooxygenase HmoA
MRGGDSLNGAPRRSAGRPGPPLLQDDEDPRRFLSFGPWDDAESIEAWRASDGFRGRVGRIRELLEDFEAHTMHAVAEISMRTMDP